MDNRVFLAFDLGAESGRAVVGSLNENRITLREVHRFMNRPVRILGRLYWNVTEMFQELKQGLISGVREFPDIESIGIDTWGVDFGFISTNNELVGLPVCYRDSRTNGMPEKVFEIIPREKLYQLTGIQIMQINSIFQLYSMKLENSPLFNSIHKLLFMPDLFNFMFTGKVSTEFSIATTSQLYDPINNRWSRDIFDALDLPMEIMPEILDTGADLGDIYPDIREELGVRGITIVAPAEHDTGSAVAAVPAEGDNWAYISSGTWSLMGVEVKEPIITKESMDANFTNEGGINRTFRFLKNITGLWLLQGCRRSWEREGDNLSYNEIVRLAEESKPFKFFIDPDDSSFLNPPDMPSAIKDFCIKTGQGVPETRGEIARCIFESLAFRYKDVFETLKSLIKKDIDTLHIVGGGSQNTLLSQFTADALEVPVYTGPVEATAMGNIMVQAMAKGAIKDLEEGRRLIKNSFETVVYYPKDVNLWEKEYERFKNVIIR
ncbi:MAG TPA: rhamnulokinase family protein [bacterium]|nr:rhamnulokinase family protein [bacterium]